MTKYDNSYYAMQAAEYAKGLVSGDAHGGVPFGNAHENWVYQQNNEFQELGLGRSFWSATRAALKVIDNGGTDLEARDAAAGAIRSSIMKDVEPSRRIGKRAWSKSNDHEQSR